MAAAGFVARSERLWACEWAQGDASEDALKLLDAAPLSRQTPCERRSK